MLAYLSVRDTFCVNSALDDNFLTTSLLKAYFLLKLYASSLIENFFFLVTRLPCSFYLLIFCLKESSSSSKMFVISRWALSFVAIHDLNGDKFTTPSLAS